MKTRFELQCQMLLLACFVLGTPVYSQQSSASLQMAIQMQTNKESLLQITSAPPMQHLVEVSTNALNWQSLVSFTGGSVTQHVDSGAPYRGQRFYRMSIPALTNLTTGDHLSTDDGDVVIRPLNHATFVMAWKDKLIAVDPPASGAAYFTGIPRAHLVLITHGHSDHFSTSTLDSIRTTTAVIIAPQAVYNSMTSAQKALTTIMTNGSTTNTLSIGIEAVPAYNLTSSNHPKGQGNGYVVTIGNRRIYISSDTEDTPEARSMPNIDLAFLNINSYTLTEDKAIQTIRSFKPKVIYPCHYQRGSTTIDLNRIKRLVGTDLGIEVRLRKWY